MQFVVTLDDAEEVSKPSNNHHSPVGCDLMNRSGMPCPSMSSSSPARKQLLTQNTSLPTLLCTQKPSVPWNTIDLQRGKLEPM